MKYFFLMGLISSAASAASCLDQAGPLITLSGPQSAQYFKTSLLASTKVDLRAASWSSQIGQPIKIGGGDKICASGGSIQGTWDPLVTPWDTYHYTYAFSVYGNNMTVENLRVDGYGDAITIRTDVDKGNNFTLRSIHVTNSHDDCVQNDGMKAGLIQDSLFDGCYNFYSSRGYGNAPTNLVRIENNLARVQGYPTYYTGQAADPTDPSQFENGGFWKIDEFDKAPKLAIHNNIFRVDKDSRGWVPLMPDARSISSCSNNVIVWLGSGPFPEKLPACFTITTDKSVWDKAVADWKYRHGAGPAPVTDPVGDPVTDPEPDPEPIIDNEQPMTAITSPADGSYVPRNTTVTIKASASDNVGVKTVRFYVNGTRICTDSTAPYTCNWKVPRKLGSFDLRSKASDEAGNTFSSDFVSVKNK